MSIYVFSDQTLLVGHFPYPWLLCDSLSAFLSSSEGNTLLNFVVFFSVLFLNSILFSCGCFELPVNGVMLYWYFWFTVLLRFISWMTVSIVYSFSLFCNISVCDYPTICSLVDVHAGFCQCCAAYGHFCECTCIPVGI